jgi:cytidylate kinase
MDRARGVDVLMTRGDRSVGRVSSVTSEPSRAAEGGGPRLVTVSAAYGAGGSVVAPALARRLGVPFLQRATTTVGEFAEGELGSEGVARDEEQSGPIHWLLASLSHSMPTGPTQSPPTTSHQHEEMRRTAETGIRRLATEDAGVILGRGAAVVLGKDHGFHVRLDGPAEFRIQQGAEIEGIGIEEARAHQHKSDRARTNYVRRLYHCDPADASHYHLVIDSTALPLDAVVEIILQARAAHVVRIT